MEELVSFDTNAGPILIELDDSQSGFELVERGGAASNAKKLLEETLASMRDAASSALGTFRGGVHPPETVEVEFGVKLTAQTGAVVAKTAAEGHFLVRLRWTSPQAGTEPHANAD